ncbi:MAG: protein kinase [Deltaproteobacteria bacterium]|nr:protein kinase [Deltaproteobacteria bacterium]
MSEPARARGLLEAQLFVDSVLRGLGLTPASVPSAVRRRLDDRARSADRELVIGRYLVVGELGRGGMGLVLEAWDPEIERRVAIKTIEPERVAEEERDEIIERFRLEMKLVGCLRHPAIVAIYDSGRTEITFEGGADSKTLHYYVMEFIEGESLAQTLKRRRSLSDIEAASIARDLAEALAVAHRAGIVHRDIKPSNVFLRDGRQAVLLDFGIAKTESVAITKLGQILGTPSYLAPERLRERPADVDGRADIFSLGVLLYAMVTGEAPFPGDDVYEVIDKIARIDPPKLPAGGAARQVLAAVVDRMLAKDPRARYQSASDVSNALKTVLAAADLEAGSGAGRMAARAGPTSALAMKTDLVSGLVLAEEPSDARVTTVAYFDAPPVDSEQWYVSPVLGGGAAGESSPVEGGFDEDADATPPESDPSSEGGASPRRGLLPPLRAEPVRPVPRSDTRILPTLLCGDDERDTGDVDGHGHGHRRRASAHPDADDVRTDDVHDDDVHDDDVHDGDVRDDEVHDGDVRDDEVHDGDVHDGDVHDDDVHGEGVHDDDVHDSDVHDDDVHDGDVHDDDVHEDSDATQADYMAHGPDVDETTDDETLAEPEHPADGRLIDALRGQVKAHPVASAVNVPAPRSRAAARIEVALVDEEEVVLPAPADVSRGGGAHRSTPPGPASNEAGYLALIRNQPVVRRDPTRARDGVEAAVLAVAVSGASSSHAPDLVPPAPRKSAAIARRTVAVDGASPSRASVRAMDIRVEADGLHRDEPRRHILRRRLVVLAASVLASVAFGLWLGRREFSRSEGSGVVTITPAPTPQARTRPAVDGDRARLSGAHDLGSVPAAPARSLPAEEATEVDHDQGRSLPKAKASRGGEALGRSRSPGGRALAVGGDEDEEDMPPEQRCTLIMRRNLGQPKDAIQALGALRRDHPRAPCIFWHLGVQYEKLGDLLAAKAAFRRYLMVEPTSDRRDAVERRIQALDQKLERR